jgi:hypothetical protein
MKWRLAVVIAVAGGLAGSGCTYLRNRGDDLTDIFSFGVGGVTGRGPFPPCFGLYLEATEFVHVGGMRFSGSTVGMDRRGAAVAAVAKETRIGFGPIHRWTIDESYGPADIYKSGAMALWESRMGSEPDRRPTVSSVGVSGPVAAFYRPSQGFHDSRSRPSAWKKFQTGVDDIPAKRMRFHDAELWAFPRGWQDWGYIGFDVALSEPFLLHMGGRVRAGFDISQIADFFLGVFAIDIYHDDATADEYAAAKDG